MLLGECIHPDIMKALSYCGHGSKILIADGNYPLAEKTGTCPKVYLGLRRGLPTVTDVLETLKTAINIERAQVMAPDAGPEPEVFGAFRALLGLELETLGRYDFYEACMAEGALALAVSTGEGRTFANILITVGCA